MQSPTILIANSDPARVALIARGLSPHSSKLVTATSGETLRNAVLKHRAEVVIADLETVSLDDVRRLRNELAGVSVVCTHRVPDEQMWAAALEAGADDCCCTADVDDVVRAAFHRPYKVRSQAA
ncbi:MAG TPA: hypothetical protein VE998_05855 [Terriglobales bacterium]|nr:hypothetical protein [Terriglobales bacterium]